MSRREVSISPSSRTCFSTSRRRIPKGTSTERGGPVALAPPGVAIGLVSEAEAMTLDAIAKRYSIDLESRPVPTDADVAAVVAERVTTLLEARLRERDSLKTERSQRFVPLARSLAENEDESALIAMLVDDYYQETLHAPVIKPQDEPSAPSEGQSQLASGGRPRRRSSPRKASRRRR